MDLIASGRALRRALGRHQDLLRDDLDAYLGEACAGGLR